MGFPLIILGAGAAYDCIDKSQYIEHTYKDNDLDKFQPPLANQIFDTTRFYNLIEQYKEIGELVSYINNKISSSNISFEECLTDIKNNKAKTNPDRLKEIVTLRFYLSDLFSTISDKYYKIVNNYNDLIGQIKDSGGDSLFINFNYDLILEKTMGFDFNNIDNYITGHMPIIKIHGACNWYYRRLVNGFETRSAFDFSILASQWLIENEASLKTNEIIIINENNSKNIQSDEYDPIKKVTYLPALAVPLNDKYNYVCPQNHIKYLEDTIKFVDRIIIIGWKAGDQFLVDFLNEKFKDKNIPIAIIGGQRVKEEVLTNIKNLGNNIKIIDNLGFSHFMKSQKCEEFLNI